MMRTNDALLEMQQRQQQHDGPHHVSAAFEDGTKPPRACLATKLLYDHPETTRGGHGSEMS